jgi:signal transduction histidine kinase
MVSLTFIYEISYAQKIDSVILANEYQKSLNLIEGKQIDSAILILSNIVSQAEEKKYWNLYTDSKINLARVYEEKEDVDETIKNYIELIRILEKNDLDEQLAITYYSLGVDYAKYGLYNKAIRYFSTAINFFEKIKNYNKVAETFIRQGELYFIMKNFKLSDSAISNAIFLIEEHNLVYDILPFLSILVMIYDNLGEPELMLEANQMIFEIYMEQNNLELIAEIQSDLGYNYATLGNYEMALSKFMESYRTSSSIIAHDTVKINTLTNIGIAYSLLNMNSVALDTFFIVENYYGNIEQPDKLARVQNLIAEIYLIERDLSTALLYSKISIENAEKSGDLIIKRDCYRTYSEIYQESNDFKNGMKYYRIYVALNDSITILNRQKDYELSKREEDRSLLERKLIRMVMDEEIEELAYQNLQIENEKSRKENALLKAEQELEKETMKRRLLIMVFCFLAVFLILIVIGYFAKQRDNKLLLQQKDSILNKNEELASKNNDLASAMDQLKMTQGKLVESEKMASLGQLTAGVAHEINNPVNFVSSNVVPLKMGIKEIVEILDQYRSISDIKNFKESMKKAKTLEEKYDLNYLIKELDILLNGIADGAERTKDIVLGLRNFSRIDKQVLNETNLHETLDSTLLLLRNKYKDHVEIIREYDRNIPMIECYPGQLSQVFMNILNNAIQAITKEGKIIIKTELSGNDVIVYISDNGKGIDKGVMRHIFDPFFTTKEVGEGTGLGLSISYGIIQEHKGQIQVDSQIGEGTTFKIVFPLRQTV